MRSIRRIFLITATCLLALPQVFVFPSSGFGNSLQQRAPQQQKQLLESLPTKDEKQSGSELPKFNEPKSEAQHHQQAQILYRYLRKVRGLDHEAALEELKEADFPTSRIREL